VLYIEPSKILEWQKNFIGVVTTWLNVDAEKYDQSVQPSETEKAADYFYPDYEFKDLLVEYSNKADLVMPDEIISRNGGMPSGKKTTNLEDGFDNINDLLEALDKMGLYKYVVCILVNGDDITIGLSTKLTQEISLSSLSYPDVQ
jgi:hypothetical protein